MIYLSWSKDGSKIFKDWLETQDDRERPEDEMVLHFLETYLSQDSISAHHPFDVECVYAVIRIDELLDITISSSGYPGAYDVLGTQPPCDGQDPAPEHHTEIRYALS